MTSYDVTLRALSLGSQDSITGWYAKSFSESTIKMVILRKGETLTTGSYGYYGRYEFTGYTSDVVDDGDEIKDSVGRYFELENVTPHYQGDSFHHRECQLVELPLHGDRPSTYGTGSSVEDPRHRTKDWLDAYLSAANLKEDNGSTNADYITCWDGADYPIKKVFVTKGIDLIFTCANPSSEPILTSDQTPRGYNEKAPITTYVINKSTITGINLLNQAETELRRIAPLYPFGSLRTIDKMEYKPQVLGSTTLYSREFTINYSRGLT